MKKKILFEHPMSEKCRTLLRLAHLFEQFEYHLSFENVFNSRAALTALLDIATVLQRADIKSELIQELERHYAVLSRIKESPEVDQVRLEQILQDISSVSRALKAHKGQLGHKLRTNELLKSIIQRAPIPGGSFDFDLPQLHYWLEMDHSERLLQLDSWRSEIESVQESVELLLSLIRASSRPQKKVAPQGLYSQQLGTGKSIQLIRVSLVKESSSYAEISGGKHRLSIRFTDSHDSDKPIQTEQDIQFELAICAI